MSDFERYAPAIAAFFGAFGIAVPMLFAAVTFSGGSPVTPQQYGEIVYAIPALVWAGLQLAIGGMGCAAALMRWSFVCAAAGFSFFVLMTFFAAAAIIAGPTGTLVVAGAGAGVAPLAALAAGIAWRGRYVR